MVHFTKKISFASTTFSFLEQNHNINARDKYASGPSLIITMEM